LIGPALFEQTALTYVAFVSVALVSYVLYATPIGLGVRMVGENPKAAESQGVNVHSVRIGAVMVGSAFMAIGGCFLTLSAFNAFYVNMMQGRGWICIALVVFASWRPGKAMLGALLFAGIDAFQLRLQQKIGAYLPYQVFLMLPYVMSIVALMIVARRAAYPKALMVPYVVGER
jgi:simple sugar transport system permease protein